MCINTWAWTKVRKDKKALCQQNTHASKHMPLDWYVQRQLQDDDAKSLKIPSTSVPSYEHRKACQSGQWCLVLRARPCHAPCCWGACTRHINVHRRRVRREISRPNSPTYSAKYLRGSSVVWYCRGLLRKCLHCGAGCPSDWRGSTCGCGRQYRDDTTSFSKLKLECQRKSCGVCMSACKRAECSRNDTHAEICAVRGIVSPRRPHQCAHPHASIEICTCLSCKDHRSPGLLGFVLHHREPALTKRLTKRQFQSVPHQFHLSPDQHHQDTCRYQR